MNRALALLIVVALLAGAPAGAEWSRGGGSEVPLDDAGGTSWLVHATLNGRFSGLFLLDTGASLCVLAPSTAHKLDIPATGSHVLVQTANGTVRAPVVRVASIEVGKNRARDVSAVVHPAVAPPLAGVIGLSFLNNFRYAIDSKRKLLRLE